MHTIAVVSGGLDSVTLAHHLADAGHRLELMSFDYGQRHRRELELAAACAARLDAPHHEVDLTSLAALLAGSSLTSVDVDVPDGHYAEENMSVTVVPNRNAIMISIAAGYAVNVGADAVAVGVHGGDHFVYPDCRPGFVRAIDTALFLANEGYAPAGFAVRAPFVHWSKADIVREGARLGVPWTQTWSCYKGGHAHCGTCGTCVERKEAFVLAGVTDPTDYER
ncbi:MAG: 7-cyano-7-deazaguanine synthase QueC [Acidimicrobiales bacterium]|nr:7-cyano-7-deazaguanine synthase QueC [Acidimicrobiales bacterium]